MCAVLVLLANISFQKGEWERVQSFYSRVLRLAKSVDDGCQIAVVHMNSGIMETIRGRQDRALELFEKSLRGYTELNDRSGLGQVYLNMGWMWAGQKAWEQARDAYQSALTLSRELRNIFMEAKCHLNLAEVFLETAELDASKRACLKAIEIFKKVNNQSAIADVFKTLGQVSVVEQKWADARTYFEKSISAYETLQNPLGAGSARMAYARMLRDQNECEAAQKEVARATELFSKIEATEELKVAKELAKELDALLYLASFE